jgi:hypothetical protein
MMGKGYVYITVARPGGESKGISGTLRREGRGE